MLSIIRDRRKPTQFFTGELGCYCCPPDPPPPPVVTQYYLPKLCQCTVCDFAPDGVSGQPIACRWKIEVSGYANHTQSGCSVSGTDCASLNGTFVLDPVTTYTQTPGGFPVPTSEVCTFSSPLFTATARPYRFVSSGCFQCLNAVSMRWTLHFYKNTIAGGFIPTAALRLQFLDPISGFYDEVGWWKKEYPNCIASNEMIKQWAFQIGARTACCAPDPATITISPA